MEKTKTLIQLKAEDIDRIKNRPAISVFRDNMSLGAILEKAYIMPNYHLRKHDFCCTGIMPIFNQYKNKNVVFIGEAGAGKTSAFLRLYTGTAENSKTHFDAEFYYCFAPDLLGSSKTLNDYQKALRRVIEAGAGLSGILLLDGIEEAFLANSKDAKMLLQKLSNSSINFWVSCRTNFYKRLDDSINSLFAEIVEVENWGNDSFEEFISLCLKNNNNRKEIEKRINGIKPHVQSLLHRPLFATMILFVAENNDLDTIDNEYELIDLFLNKWLERDEKDKKSKTKIEEVNYEGIRDIALCVYLKNNKRPQYNKSVSAFRDLLVMSNTSRGTIHGFYHREFLTYFIVNAMIDAALEHSDRIIWWFSQTFYDDITNIIKPVLSSFSAEKSKTIYKNLFSVYKWTCENPNEAKREFELRALSPEESLLRLRDEVIYFIFRLPNINHEIFARYAYDHYLADNCKDTILFLGIAYGMAGIDPSNSYTLEFAKKLTPGTAEDIRNRGWGMCFFGDVEENGYIYKDLDKRPWTKIRENRLNRLSDNEKRHVTRVLDIPLLYCFYSNREYADCTSYREYVIIKNTDISLPCFRKEQREFLKQQKNQLVSMYLKHLLLSEINSKASLVEAIQKECIIMNHETGKTMIEVDDQLADRILKQAQYREDVVKNLKSFWGKKGERIIGHYRPLLSAPKHHSITEKEFMKELKNCQVLVISANSIEGAIISWRLQQSTGKPALDAWPHEGHLFQFADIEGIPVCHIWPADTASFTQYGSFSALEAALENTMPKYVMSVGVAFGIDPNNQSLGDVLVSKELVFYDHFNKVTDGRIKLNSHETYRIDPNLSSQLHQLDNKTPPKEVGNFSWYYGSMLTGGTVLSDAAERGRLIEAAANLGHTIVGGEMEASGIYYACQKRKDRHIPFMIIKGICDWGAVKNGWEEVVGNNYPDCDGDTIKDCVQAFSCDNAFNTLHYILKQLNYNQPSTAAKTEIAKTEEMREANSFSSVLMDLYNTTVSYRNALQSGDVQEINNQSEIIQSCIQQVFSYYELHQYSDREAAKKAKQIVDLFNAYVDSYGKFISCSPGEERSTASAQQYAKDAENTFNLMIAVIAKYIAEEQKKSGDRF